MMVLQSFLQKHRGLAHLVDHTWIVIEGPGSSATITRKVCKRKGSHRSKWWCAATVSPSLFYMRKKNQKKKKNKHRTLSRIWGFLSPGWINSMFADSFILKLIIKPSKPAPWGHFPIVCKFVVKVSLSYSEWYLAQSKPGTLFLVSLLWPVWILNWFFFKLVCFIIEFGTQYSISLFHKCL